MFVVNCDGMPRKSTKTKLSLTERMARIRKVDTRPEMIVRRAAHGLGYRFRLHRRDLPGVPDLVFIGLRKVIFVHGCFWHRHTCRDGTKLPRSKPDYWGPKLARNAARDAEHQNALHDLGWDVLVIWECELGLQDQLRETLTTFLRRTRPARRTSPPKPSQSPREPPTPPAGRARGQALAGRRSRAAAAPNERSGE